MWIFIIPLYGEFFGVGVFFKTFIAGPNFFGLGNALDDVVNYTIFKNCIK